MKAIVVERFGEPEVLQFRDAPEPTPGPGQVRVRMEVAGVNFSDTERRRALYRIPALPWIPGNEGAGVVDGLGEGVDPSWSGARVAFWSFESSGAYAGYAVAPAHSLFRVPDAIALDVAAALPVQGLTAYGLAHFATSLAAGQSALVHAAAGGVGLLLIQMLRRRGVVVFGTASSPAKLDLIRSMGATPLPYGEGLAEGIRGVRGVPTVDAVFDSVGRATQDQSLALLGLYGHLIFFGDASGAPHPVDPDALYGRSLKVSAFGLGAHPPAELSRAREELLQWVAAGELRVHIGHTLPLADAAEAHRLLESRRSQGKIVLRTTAPV
ncbi:MAG: quinone oxidoreductase [Vicinamibacteria bacterium]|nr:quinone oxidoreductase [Vicinamibacteria bacterium]